MHRTVAAAARINDTYRMSRRYEYDEATLTSLEHEIRLEFDRRIYCNRDLNLDAVQWVGFDMDYTLAIYQQEEFDALTWRLASRSLVDNYGYPAELPSMEYDPEFAIRGLVVDHETGNILKMNVFRHVGKAYHGGQPLTADEIAAYAKRPPQISSERFRLLDTLFEMPEALLFGRLVELLEGRGLDVDYRRVAGDVRAAIDGIHADESLKSQVMNDLSRYVFRDPELPHTLHRLRSEKKKLFLMTNSHYPYTNAVMDYLLGGSEGAYPDWKRYFDVIVTAASKPAFFRSETPFYILDADGKVIGEEHEGFQRSVAYQHGNLAQFERFIGLSGQEILYVGDHIFGDILRSKIDSNWRTCMIIPEMERELVGVESSRDLIVAWTAAQSRLERIQAEIESRQDSASRLSATLSHDVPSEDRSRRTSRLIRPLTRRIDVLRRQAREVLERTFEYERSFDHEFSSRWGSLFKEGNELSLFGSQVSQFACVYTSRVSNFSAYSTQHFFRSPPQRMPHEQGYL